MIKMEDMSKEMATELEQEGKQKVSESFNMVRSLKKLLLLFGLGGSGGIEDKTAEFVFGQQETIDDTMKDLFGFSSDALLRDYAQTYGISDMDEVHKKMKRERDVRNDIVAYKKKFREEKGIEYGEGEEHVVFSMNEKGEIGDTRIYKDPKGVIMSYTKGDEKARVANEQERKDYFEVQEKPEPSKKKLELNAEKSQDWPPTKKRINKIHSGQLPPRSARGKIAAIGKINTGLRRPGMPVKTVAKGISSVPIIPFK